MNLAIPTEPWSDLVESLRAIRERTLVLVDDLDDGRMLGPRLEIVNPPQWEIGHVAWFQEYWILRHARGHASMLPNGDAVYDSSVLTHEERWDAPLLGVHETRAYLERVLERVCAGDEGTDRDRYFLALALAHECMHAEALTYTRQTLGYCAPLFRETRGAMGACHDDTAPLGDAEVPGGTFLLGSNRGKGFAFDNEQWAHEVTLEPFRIARTVTSNGELRGFVEDGGYERRELWSDEGWRWRVGAGATHPVYWLPVGGQWMRREFERIVPLDDRLPAINVNWYEADAYCRWAGRRLPSEAEWEAAATAEATPDGAELTGRKRRFPWGDSAPDATRANLEWRAGVIPADALPESASAFGCRQMLGNVWEWTANAFLPYPGFEPGPYREYSEPWFGDHKVLRGGCWATSRHIARPAYRNFYTPDRRDVWAGFRTCAL